jgi:hypothetical protein
MMAALSLKLSSMTINVVFYNGVDLMKKVSSH